MNWTLISGHRAAPEFTEPRPAHPKYTAVDPAALATRLNRAGLETATIYGGTRRGLLAPRTAILQVTYPISGPYHPACNIYLDHRGRSAIKVTCGALRVACENSFTSPVLRIPHCSPEAADFLARPYHYLRPLLQSTPRTMVRIESMRSTPGGLSLIHFLETRVPRLATRVFRSFEEYSLQGDVLDSWWAALQALTSLHSRRLDEFAGRLLEAPGPYADDVLEAAWN